MDYSLLLIVENNPETFDGNVKRKVTIAEKKSFLRNDNKQGEDDGIQVMRQMTEDESK